jgi:hypothetical protein
LWVAAVALAATGIAGVLVLLSGNESDTSGRILGTTAAIAGASLLAVPGAVLFDRMRALLLARITVGLAGVNLLLVLIMIWGVEDADALWKTFACAIAAGLACTQTSALVATRREGERPAVHGLFVAATVVVAVVAALGAVGAVAEVENDVFWRIFGALSVVDIVLVLMRPIVRRMVPPGAEGTGGYRLQITVEPGGEREVIAQGHDLAAAVSAEIHRAEESGERVVRIDVLGEPAAHHNLPGARGRR